MYSTRTPICLRSFIQSIRHYCKDDRPVSVSVMIGSRMVNIEKHRLARIADGSCIVSSGNTAVLATAVSKQKGSNTSFMPLTVDFKPSAAALGRIPTNYLRRELGQSDADVLTARMIDRSIRPLFPIGYGCETQLICKPLSIDDTTDPAVLSINAASAALAISDIPWNGPVAAVRLGLVDNEIIINPTRSESKRTSLNMILTGLSNQNILMIDMDGAQIGIELLERCIDTGMREICKLINSINELKSIKPKSKREVKPIETDVELESIVSKFCESRVWSVFTNSELDKMQRDSKIRTIRDDAINAITRDFPSKNEFAIDAAYSRLTKKIFRDLISETGIRCDGRRLDDPRNITCQTNVFERLHGSALFQRGQTQVLASVTFDSPDTAFRPDIVSALTSTIGRKAFMLHYEFPPFATNEIGTGRGANRREVGHGALAEKALKHIVPEQFPFAIRLACEVLESNGSSSMASACAGTLALLDAGVPIKESVAGVAIGLIKNEVDSKYTILTDILGIEDYMGDMDFKIAGTRHGFTAMQLDLKLAGISRSVLNECLLKARRGIDHVLDVMAATQSERRLQFKSTVPASEQLTIPPHKRSILFGNAGFNLKMIEAETGVRLLASDDSGNVQLFAPDSVKMIEAKEMIEKLIGINDEIELDFGVVYRAKIVDILEHGVLISVRDGARPILLSNDHLDSRRVQHASALGLKVGDEVRVKYFGRDPATGKHRVSRKFLLTVEQPERNMLNRTGGT